ncbi:hypothetical protein ACFLUN_01290 [Chloroflexota bacterium]
MSGSFKRISQTYKELKDEELGRYKVSLTEESEVLVVSDEETLPVEPVPEVEPEPASELEPIPEPEPVAKPKSKAATKAKSPAKPKAAPRAKAKSKARPKAVANPGVAVEPEAEIEADPAPIPAPGPETTPAEMDIAVEELLSAYETEGADADKRFSDKILKVTGVVDRIEVKDRLDIYYMNLGSAEKNYLQHLRCVFNRYNSSDLNQLEAGQTVTVQGRYDGSIMDICMRDCVLVH